MSPVTRSASLCRRPRQLVADSFAVSMLLIGLTVIVQRGIGFLRSFYVCGQLSPTEVGQWDLAFHFLMLSAPLAVLGIPGSFGRYVVQFEQRGQLNRLLYRTSLVCLILALSASGLLWLNRLVIAKYCFGDIGQGPLVGMLACGLPVVVCFNFATSWFTAKRLNRVVIRIQTLQTIAFAIGCLIAFQVYRVSAAAVVLAYFCSVGLGLLLAAAYAFHDRYESSEPAQDDMRSLWRRILPFAVWVWASNALINLFTICDRMLLINFFPDPTANVQFLIGQYHAALILPALLMAIGAMAGSILVPYLSGDWEAGNIGAVGDRLNLVLKAVGVFCLFASVAVLVAAPLLFGGVWNDKFAIGESLLPMTLCYCGLAAMTLVAQKYFWCIEKTWFCSLVLLSGLSANFLIGIALIGRFGIEGVVASTLIAHAVCLLAVIWLCGRHGMQVDRGVYLVVAALSAVSLGATAAGLSLLLLTAMICFSPVVFDQPLKARLLQRVQSQLRSTAGATP